jgi:serine/threonine-protein phosphatase 4 regulatory subunit 1
VKKPLADSLHEISHIIGPENSKEYLFSSLDYILREPIDSIKLCAIRNLAKFVSQFETQTKENLIDVFLVLQKDPKKWRVRYLISSQLECLSDIYDPESVFKYIFPISLKLCNDNVSEVRMCAAGQIMHVINSLKPQKALYEMAVESLLGYAAS